MVRFVIIAVCILTLSACGFTSSGDTYREAFKAKGKKVAGQTLENAEWVICRAAPVGSVKDRYGISEEKALAYRNLCKPNISDGPTIIGPPGMTIKEEVPKEPVL